MKTSIFISSLAFPFCSFSKQDKKDNWDRGIGVGIKAGINFSNVTNASSINSTSRTGFHAGVFCTCFQIAFELQNGIGIYQEGF